MDYIIGHLVGDYLFQNDWMAMNKKANSLKGWAACLVHCLLYTCAVCSCTGWWRWDLICLVFLSHFPIDKTYIVALYMQYVGSFKRIISDTGGTLSPTITRVGEFPIWEDIPKHSQYDGLLVGIQTRLRESHRNHMTWAYLFVDNTVHLTLLWLIAGYAI
jgi:hypothetical protein